jgi:hypothetical protein
MSAFDNDPNERLLRALAEQLKVPILQIARSAELAQVTEVEGAFRTIEYTADMTLRLIDSYLLSVRLQALPVLELEPVSISAVLQDAASRLNLLAKQYGCELEVNLAGKYGPVMAHKQSLEAAYIALGYAFIEAVPASDYRHTVVLGAHKNAHGLVAGIFGNQPNITADMFRRAKALYGTAGQSTPALSASNGAGIVVANSILQAMSAPLKIAKHNRLSGLATTLLPSQQLQLI